MDAQFFCLDRHESYGETIQGLLAASLESSVSMQVHNIDSARHLGGLTSFGELYARLLVASTPPQQRLSVEVKTYDWLGQSPYVRIYWLAHSNRPPYTWTVDVPFFEQGGFAFFFPALAIRGRMVFVPKGQNDVLQRLGGTSPLTPWAETSPYHRDVVEVDFEDQADIESAVHSLAERLCQEVDRDVEAYRILHPKAKLADIARSLEVDIGLLERRLQEAAGRAGAYSHLSLDLSTDTVSFGRWNRVELRISNQSTSEISNILIFVSPGPVDILPKQIGVDLAALSVTAVPLSIKPQEPGEFPLEFKLVLSSDELLERWLPSYPIWLKVAMPEGG
jgi:hypothetical protein